MSVDAITLAQLDRSPVAVAEDADFHYDVEFVNGPQVEDLWFALRTQNIPIGCQVWFHNLDGDIAIAVPPTTVTQNNFVVGTVVDGVPPSYTCTIRIFLQLNGHPLPPDASIQLEVYVMVPAEHDAPAAPGQLVGSVTLRP